MAFDITSVLGDIARIQEEEKRKQLEYIELHLIDSNPRNYYSMDGIEELAANIQLLGLMEPLIVKDTGGRYMLISGHRRRAALRMLAEAGDLPNGMHEKIACIVESGPVLAGEDQLDRKNREKAKALAEELKLIFANSDTRVLSSSDTALQVRRIRELFTELKDLGYEFPGRMRDHVASAAKVSATRVARLDVIEKGLTEPSLRKAWEAGTLGETSAYEIARREADVQALAAKRIGPKALSDMSTDRVTSVLDACEADGNRERRQAEDLADGLQRFADASDSKSSFSPDEYLEKMHEEDDILRGICRNNLQSIMKSLMFFKDEYDFSENFRLPNIDRIRKHDPHRSYSCGWSGGDGTWIDWDSKGIRVVVPGQQFRKTWTDFYDALTGAALQAAWKTEEPKVSTADTPVLQTGTPTEPGEYMTRTGVGTEDTRQTTMWQRLEWHDGCWSFPKTGAPLPKGTNVFSWFRLPEV